MYNLNLNLYVEQVNVNNSEPGNWDENDEQALKDVVDPNTEFQSPENCEPSNPASPLESYGIPIPSHIRTSAVRKSLAGSMDHQMCDRPTPNSKANSTLFKGLDANFKSNSTDCEIPQVHAQTANHQIEMLRRNSQSRSGLEPRVHNDTRRLSSKQSSHPLIQGRQFCEDESNSKPVDSDRDYEEFQPKLPLHTLSNEPLPGMATPAHTSTSEQLAWAFRTARDRLETGSNMSGCSSRFELESNCSEQADTMSTFSDVSGYEEELYRISRLLLQDAPNSFIEKHLAKHPKNAETKLGSLKTTQHSVFSNGMQETVEMKESDSKKMKNMCTQLQIAIAEKEKYRLTLSEVETKTNLEWQQKFQEVLRQKANLGGQLEMVQSEVETLKVALVQKTKQANQLEEDSEVEKLQQTLKEIHSKNQELTMQLELCESEKSRWKEEAQDSDSSNEQLRIQLQELRIDTESKDGAIQGLKMKVADDHVQIQTLLQAKLKAESSLSTIHSEMETIQKSAQWYREQLHACQAAKVKVHQELMTTQTNVVSYSHLIERLKRESENLQLNAMETQERAVREKDTLLRKLEVIRADMMEREATIIGQLNRDDTAVETISAKLRIIEESRANESNIAVQDLEHQVDSLKLELRDKVARIESIRSENAQLFTRLNTTQKIMNDKELALQNLEIKFSNIEASNNTMSVNLNHKEEMLLTLKNEKVDLEVSLAAAAKEKEDVDAAIVKLREEFSRITKSYQSMQAELNEKVRWNRKLEVEIQEMGKLKQENNESVIHVRKVEEELNEIRGKVSRVEEWEQKVGELNNTINKLNCKLQEMKEAEELAVIKSDKLKETVAMREEQLFNQTQLFEVHSEELKSRDKLISDLHVDNNSLQDHIENLKTKIVQLELLYNEKCIMVDFKTAQLTQANLSIEQSSRLCKGSKQGNHLLKELVMKEIETEAVNQENTRNDISTQTNVSVINTGIQVGECAPLENSSATKLTAGVQDDKREIEMLKCSLRMSDVEKHEKQRRYEANIRTLLRKVKEHMRARKVAEKALGELQSANSLMEMPVGYPDPVVLQAEIVRLEAEREVAKRQYDELMKVMEQNESTVLELEKEIGKLAQKQVGAPISTLDDPERMQNSTSNIKVTKMNGQVSELEEQVRKQQIIIKELRMQIFVEKRNSSQLRKQVTSLRMGMDTANDVLDSKKVDLGRSEAMGELLREANSRLHRDLENEQISHERCKLDLDKVTQKLEERKANEPILADQMKMLSYHLHQKTQEASNMEGMMLLQKNGWASTENGLKQNIVNLKNEISSLCEELATVRAEKFTLQSQAVELRAGLQSSQNQNELLQLRVEAYQNGSDKDCDLPDLMSSLPLAPIKYDQLQFAELLNYSTSIPHNKPLSNLQSCLESLKEEMATLQQQVVAKTSGQSGLRSVVNGNGVTEI